LEFGVRLFKAGMNPSVMSWNAASNNQALNARQTGYILNSISAYRTAQDNKLPVADDIFFVPALREPRGTRWASEHVMGIYGIWKYAQSPDFAKQFLLDLIGRYRDAVLGSKLYNFPSFPGSVADPGVAVGQKPASGNKWLEQVTANDPFGSNPPSKLKPISTALQWATNIGHPGPANPAESEVFDTFVLPTMFANAATGRGLSCCCFASSRACVWAASMAAPSPTSPSMRPTRNGATTPAGSRRRPRSASWCPSWSSS